MRSIRTDGTLDPISQAAAEGRRTLRRRWIGIVTVLAGCAAHPVPPEAVQDPLPTAEETRQDRPAGQSADDADELARKATDPTASLMALNFVTDHTGSYHGTSVGPDHSTEVQFKPVIPFRAFDFDNILRITMPYQVGGRGEEGQGDTTLFDLAVVHEDWGRWGLGPVMTFASDDLAPDQFVIGPAIGGVYQHSKALNLGLFSQNVFGEQTAISQIQPVVAYQLGDGWSLSAGDLQYTYDWERDRWLNVPLGFQLGKVLQVGKQPMRFSINPQYNLIDDSGLPEWSVSFTMTLLVPGS